MGESLFVKLISAGAKESTKHFLALYIVIVLGTIITVFALWKTVDYIFLLATWLTFVAALLGLAEYNKNRKLMHNADVKKEALKQAPTTTNTNIKEEVKVIIADEHLINDDNGIT